MLDMSHPHSQFVFEASNLIDGINGMVRLMTLCRVTQRVLLYDKCGANIKQLRELNLLHFENKQFIVEALDELERKLYALASPPREKAPRHSLGPGDYCPLCNSQIEMIDTMVTSMPLMVMCSTCFQEYFLPSKMELESHEGFGTDAI